MNEKVRNLLNEQINKELFSAYLYLDFANYFTERGLDGFANWYTVQAEEERDHAMLFLKFLQNESKKVTLLPVDAPNRTYDSDIHVLESGLEHEEYVTSLINTIYTAAREDNDYRTMQFLDWFVKEQGEEEKNAHDLIDRHQLFGLDARGLYLLDRELATRVYSAPSLVL